MATSAVAFDPSTAKPVGFDPITARPVTPAPKIPADFQPGLYGTTEIAPTSMLPPRQIGQGAGAAAGQVLGVPGDIASLAPSTVDFLAGTNLQRFVAPFTSGAITKDILGKPKSQADIQSRQAGNIAANVGMALPAVVAAPEVVGEVAPKVGKFLPGAMKRAESTVGEIGPISDVKMSALGDKMMADLRGRFDAMVAKREADTEAAFQKMGGFWRKDPEAVQEVRRRAFREASKDINKFAQQNPIGKMVAGNLSPYSNVPKLAHSSLPVAAFKDGSRYEALRDLVGEQKAETYAGEYAATGIKDAIDRVKPPIGKPRLPGSTIANMAKAAENWQKANSGWLDKTEATKVAVQFSIDQLKAAAKAASKIRAGVVGSAAATALYQMGENGAYWLRYALSKL